MTMKKVMMGLALLLALTGCGKGNDEKKADTKDSSEKTEQSSTTKESSSEEKEANAVKELADNYPKVILPTDIPYDESRKLNVASDGNKDKLSVLYYVMDEALVLNNKALNEQEPFAQYQKETFKTAAEAKTAVNAKLDTGGQEVDLGHKITGYQQGAAGSTFLNWQEGNWSIVVQASNLTGQDPVAQAKEVVEYLEKAELPAPKDSGQITIDMEVHDYKANVVTWQKDKVVYTVSHQDPLPALRMAVSMNQ